jgi:hypothetical protein
VILVVDRFLLHGGGAAGDLRRAGELRPWTGFLIFCKIGQIVSRSGCARGWESDWEEVGRLMITDGVGIG